MSWNCTTNSAAFHNTTVNISIPAKLVKPWGAVYLFLCFKGAVGNLLIVCLTLANRKLRTGCGLLIAHCLLTYTILCGFSFPIVGTSVYRKLVYDWQMDPKHCKLFQWIQMGARFASHWFDLYIAINRIVALIFPHHYRRFSRKTVQGFVVAFIWIGAFGTSLLGWFDWALTFVMIPLGTCACIPKGHFGMILYTIVFYLPSVITAGLYISIYLKI
ncbi:melatonin receptor type 1B-like, partial [Paramacrobiotus metropolitanus]|uniref:melatonin receptor type 1B-like n=1 Tax=Paramacrobiotus metropolitanus TaxID=2943436 RepID=UPI00244634A1